MLLRDHRYFQTFIIFVILLAGAIVGVLTYDVTDDALRFTLTCVPAIARAGEAGEPGSRVRAGSWTRW